jgi:hypothetical protein
MDRAGATLKALLKDNENMGNKLPRGGKIRGRLWLRFFDDYLEGTGNGSRGADCLALQTPATIFRFNNHNHIANHHQGAAIANAKAQPAAVTLIAV